MQNQLILPSKRRIDIKGITIPFEQLLRAGQEIDTGAVTVEVFTGTDDDPSHILDGGCQVRGTTLYQKIKLGEVGVIYQLTFSATTDDDEVYTVEAVLAVLPHEIPAFPLYDMFYFSSTPYPQDHIDGLGAGVAAVNAIFLSGNVDGFGISIAPTTGQLRDLVQAYTMEPEALDVLLTPVDGELRDIVKSYNIPPERINVVLEAVEGTLRGVLVQYSNYPPEALELTFTPVSGTLT